MTWDGNDRRRKKRFAVKNSTLRYKTGGALSFVFPWSSKYLLLNFSATGCHFITREEMAPRRALKVAIDAPNLKGTITTGAHVVWCRKSSDINAFRVGCSFDPLPDRPMRLLKNLLDSSILENVEISTKVYLKEIERL